jgi:hypothetical protein
MTNATDTQPSREAVDAVCRAMGWKPEWLANGALRIDRKKRLVYFWESPTHSGEFEEKIEDMGIFIEYLDMDPDVKELFPWALPCLRLSRARWEAAGKVFAALEKSKGKEEQDGG